MNHFVFLAAPLALCLFSTHAVAAAEAPPAEYAAHVAALRKADAITDPLQRCLAYPDLPGNTWAPGVAKARCTMFLTPRPYSLDAIDKLLAQPGGAATLDAAFGALLDAHFKVPAQREHVDLAFGVFGDKDHDKAERVARAWLAAAPESAFAHTALGYALSRRGWDARGTKYVSDTPDESLQRMTGYFIDAAKEYSVAMEANPKLFSACKGLMAIGRQSSDEVQAFATKRCLEADPSSFSVIEELMTASEPRWGGSEGAMRAVSAYAMARQADNPVLAVFAFNHAYDAIAQMDDGDAQAIAVLEPAALQVPNAGYLRLVGGAYLRKDTENWKALAYLSQALRFAPDYAQESRFRAKVLWELGESKWARADAERAVALDPKNGYAQQLLGNIVRELDGPAAALPYFQRAMEDSNTREYAFNDYCGSLIDAKRPDDAGRCVDDLLAAYPENPEAWRQRLMVIGFDAPDSMEAMERFVALHDPKRWSRHATAADTVRKVLAAKNGKASPSDLFDARVTRAEALERSPSGRLYFERLKSPSNTLMEQTVGACQSAMKSVTKREITVVMDVQPDGSLTNVAVRPVNAWTSCFAKRFETAWKLPAPPEGSGPSGYPLVYGMRMK